MNLFEISEHLRDYSQEQLMSEMKAPTGSAPQFLIMSELQRRNRIKQQASKGPTPQTTVLDDVVSAAGVPQEGIGAMARAMAPATDMSANTGQAQAPVTRMQSGGIVDITAGSPATYSEWRTMSRSEREAAGLPTSEIGGQIHFRRFGVGMGLNDEETGMSNRALDDINPWVSATIADRPEGVYTPDEWDERQREDRINRTAAGDYASDEYVQGGYDEVGNQTDPLPMPAREEEPPTMRPLPRMERPEETLTSDSAPTGGGGSGDPMASASDRMERQNRWLALARFGLGLASSRAPTFGQAAGESGLAALDYMAAMDQQARENALAEREIAAREMTANAAMARANGGGGIDPTDFMASANAQFNAAIEEARLAREELTMLGEPTAETAQMWESARQRLAAAEMMIQRLSFPGVVQGPATQELQTFDVTQ